MSSDAAELARRLARDAETVCRYYLSNGRRQGRYWCVGDVANTPGRSLFVRLKGPDCGSGAAGKWTDAATGEHGDLLDLIAANRGLDRLRDVLDEARAFLGSPRPIPPPWKPQVPRDASGAARWLFAVSKPVVGTLAETYLRARGIADMHDLDALRFHPRCYYRGDADAPLETWPALIAGVTDLTNRVTGVHRTWLKRSGLHKAPLVDPRRALGTLLGNGVRFGIVDDVLAAGEGIETMLSLKTVLPRLPMLAALSAYHLAAFDFAPSLRRLYVARDNDAAGCFATERLHTRAKSASIEVYDLVPVLADFNADLCRFGASALQLHVTAQLVCADRERFVADPDRLTR